MNEQVALGDAPVVGFGETLTPPSTPTASPWLVAITTSVLGAATGWAIQETANSMRRRKR